MRGEKQVEEVEVYRMDVTVELGYGNAEKFNPRTRVDGLIAALQEHDSRVEVLVRGEKVEGAYRMRKKEFEEKFEKSSETQEKKKAPRIRTAWST